MRFTTIMINQRRNVHSPQMNSLLDQRYSVHSISTGMKRKAIMASICALGQIVIK